MKIRTKVLALGIAPVVITAGAIIGTVSVQKIGLNKELTAQFEAQAKTECAKAARDVYYMVQAQHEAVQLKLQGDLNVARDVLVDNGGAGFAEETVTWQAINQYTKKATQVELPKMLAGDVWLGQNADLATESPVVDKVKQMVGGTCTIFQRMNEAGDMLRVSTNVEKTDGSRAIGTYIPAINPDGTPNPVISQIMQGNTFLGRAYVVNDWYQTAYEPIYDDSREIVGVLYVGLRQESVAALRRGISDIVVGKTGYIYVLGGSGNIKGHYIVSKGGTRDGENIWEAKDADGRLFIQSIVEKAVATRDGQCDFEYYPWKNKDETTARKKVAAVTYFEPWDWVIGAGAYEDDFEDAKVQVGGALNRLVYWAVAIGLGAALLAGAYALIASLRILNPLARLNEGLRKVADGDLMSRLEENGNDEITELSRCFNTTVKDLESTLTELHRGAEQIDAGTNQVSSASQSLSSGASEQAANLEEISSSLEEMTSMTNQSADNAKAAADLSGESKGAADKGQQEMVMLSEAMDEIKASSAEIGKIIKVIDDIAFQTNLLALNAAVEAARAGEAGKGFAVVAEEVRNLAQRSAEAAKNTNSMIEEATQRADNGVSIATRVGESLEEIADGTSKVNNLLSEIASASDEQAQGIGHVNKGVSELESVVQQNAGNSEELASAAEQTAAQTGEMRSLISRFKVSELASTSSTPTLVHSRPAQQHQGGPDHGPDDAHNSSAPSRGSAKSEAEAELPLEGEDDFESF